VIVEAMNLMGYDVMALGEVDLQLGEDALRQRIAEAQFAVLSANVIVQSTGELFAKPYVIMERGGRRIGIVGLTGAGSYSDNYGDSSPRSDEPLPLERSEPKPQPAPSPLALPPTQDTKQAGSAEGHVVDTLEIVDPSVSLAAYMRELQAQTNIIIVLSNLGWELNTRLAESVPGIDLIISAGAGELVWEPLRVSSTGTLICQGGYPSANPGQTVADVKMHLDVAGYVTEHAGHFWVLDDGFEDDAGMRQLLDSYDTP